MEGRPKGRKLRRKFRTPIENQFLDEEKHVVSTPDEIGHFDHPVFEEDYQVFSYKEMNIIMRDFDGLCEILVDEKELEDNFIQPIYIDELVVLRGLSPEEDDEPD